MTSHHSPNLKGAESGLHILDKCTNPENDTNDGRFPDFWDSPKWDKFIRSYLLFINILQIK